MTNRVVLIGHPVGHSLSGGMQQAAFDAEGLDIRYELWDRAPLVLPDTIAELRGEEFVGANVTIPHKEKAVPLVDKVTDEAHATGAVNTITKDGKRLIGHNTDVAGFNVALGAAVSVDGDTMTIEGGRRLEGAATDSLDDHRLAMTFAVAGLIGGGETAITAPGSAAISYPGFYDEIERVRA